MQIPTRCGIYETWGFAVPALQTRYGGHFCPHREYATCKDLACGLHTRPLLTPLIHLAQPACARRQMPLNAPLTFQGASREALVIEALANEVWTQRTRLFSLELVPLSNHPCNRSQVRMPPYILSLPLLSIDAQDNRLDSRNSERTGRIMVEGSRSQNIQAIRGARLPCEWLPQSKAADILFAPLVVSLSCGMKSLSNGRRAGCDEGVIDRDELRSRGRNDWLPF